MCFFLFRKVLHLVVSVLTRRACHAKTKRGSLTNAAPKFEGAVRDTHSDIATGTQREGRGQEHDLREAA